MAKIFGMRFVFLLALLCAGGVWAQSVPAVMLSDFHFDPFRDPAKVNRLAAAPIGRWQAILDEPASADQAARYAELQAACGGVGDDTDEALFRSALKDSKKYIEAKGFVTVTGDLLVHKFDCRYSGSMKGKQPDGTATFAAKTANYVMEQVEAAFPAVPVYFALGNNDSECGDYRLNSQDPFFAATSAAVMHGLRMLDATELKMAHEDYEIGGYYEVPLANVHGTRLLVLDDMYESSFYKDCASAPDDAAKAAQLKWLDAQLAGAREAGDKVWVMGHIPPGPDVFNTLKHFTSVCSRSPAEFLSSNELADELVKYADVIQLALFAHTHMDEFRLLERAGAKGAVAMKLVPSISPVHGNAAAFMVARVDTTSALMLDYTVYAEGAGGKWEREYDFDETYHEVAFSAATLRPIAEHLQADRAGVERTTQAYEHNFAAGGAGSPLQLVWQEYACALTRDKAEDFRGCICPAK
jgi:sphingomyelin phosphodiesterase acid-like 3